MAGSVRTSIFAGASSGTTSLTTGSITTLSSGSTFVVSNNSEGGRANTPTDSKSNGYTATRAEATSGSGGGCRLWYKENGTGGSSHTATVTYSGSSLPSITLTELTGVDPASFDSGSANGGNDNGSPYTITSGTLAQADSIVLCLLGSDTGSNPGTLAESTGFTIYASGLNGAVYWVSGMAYKVVSATTALTPSWTAVGASDCVLQIAAFKASSGGVSHPSSGTPTAGSATVAGTAAHYVPHPSSGTPTAGSATVAGTAAHLTLHASSGTPTADSATVSGSAVRTGPTPVLSLATVTSITTTTATPRVTITI
jgi:hypothetical protein